MDFKLKLINLKFDKVIKKNCLRRALITLILLAFAPNIVHAYTGVTIVMSGLTPTNIEFVEQFKAEMLNHKSTLLKVTVIDLSLSEKLVVAENSELVIALGLKPLEAACALKHTTPVLAIFTPLTNFNILQAKSHRELGSFSTILLDQPYFRQIALIKAVMPNIKSLGILLGPDSKKYQDALKEDGKKGSLNINELIVNSEEELIPKLNKVLDESDAILAVPDGLVYNRETAQAILITSYRHQKPVFGYSQSYVKAGALGAVYTDTKSLAKQALEIALKSQQAPSLLPPPQIPKYFAVHINQQVARTLNISITDENIIYKKILQQDFFELLEQGDK
jgi:putative ABC transport system substrate-binding protein